MIYRSYKEKLNSRLKIIEAMMKFRLLILIGIILTIAFVTVMLIMDGKIYEETCSESAVYGNVVVPQAKAYFTSNITYEYRKAGLDSWSSDKPKEIGKYEVRAVSKGAFGVKIYGTIFCFDIIPKQIDIGVTDNETIYGDMPEFGAALEYEDAISVKDFNYSLLEDKIILSISQNDIIILNSDGKDVTAFYDFDFAISEVTVLKRPISLEILPVEKVYDGQALTSENYLISGELAKGEELHISFSESIVEMGEKANIPQFAILNEKRGDVTDYYDIDLKVGSLKVKARPIKIATSSQTVLYDGNEHGNAEFKMITDDEYYDLLQGHKIKVVSYPTFVNAGSYQNKTEIAITDANNNDMTDYYDIDFDYGIFIIESRHLKVRSESMIWDYDDKEHSYPYYDCESDDLLKGHSVSLSSYPIITDVGRYENKTEIKVSDALGVDVTKNYIVEYDSGILEIKPRKITVSSNSESQVYDGEEHFCSEAKLSEGELLEGHSMICSYEKFIDVGNYRNIFEVKIYNSNDKDVTENYEINYIFGTLTINKRPILLKSGSETWVYDGEEHSFPYVEVVSKNGYYDLVDKHRIDVKSSMTIRQITDTETDVRYEQNIIKSECIEISDIYNDNVVTDNYEIKFDSYGNLRIKTPTIVMLSSKKKVYDGLPLTFDIDTDYRIIKQPPNEKAVLNQYYPISLIDASSISLETIITTLYVNAYDTLNNNELIADDETRVEYVGDEITLEILKREIEISSVSAERANGVIEFEDRRAYLSIGSLANGHSMHVEVTGVLYYNQKGPVENTIESVIIFDENGNDVTNNYDITLRPGTLGWITNWGSKY